MADTGTAKDLVQLIRDNPGCVAIIDNDCWELFKEHPDEAPDDDDGYDAWKLENRLCGDGEIKPLYADHDGLGNCYGGDILDALAQIVGITVDQV